MRDPQQQNNAKEAFLFLSLLTLLLLLLLPLRRRSRRRRRRLSSASLSNNVKVTPTKQCGDSNPQPLARRSQGIASRLLELQIHF
jgi:hypothetical protein